MYSIEKYPVSPEVIMHPAKNFGKCLGANTMAPTTSVDSPDRTKAEEECIADMVCTIRVNDMMKEGCDVFERSCETLTHRRMMV